MRHRATCPYQKILKPTVGWYDRQPVHKLSIGRTPIRIACPMLAMLNFLFLPNLIFSAVFQDFFVILSSWHVFQSPFCWSLLKFGNCLQKKQFFDFLQKQINKKSNFLMEKNSQTRYECLGEPEFGTIGFIPMLRKTFTLTPKKGKKFIASFL